ncbi:MAG: cyanophycinase [Burkholderiaceae bacterium]|nr:cyanophycinase [Burkholderiaceae bacterium]
MRNKVSSGKYVHTLFICIVICIGVLITPQGYAEVSVEKHKRGSLIIVGGGDTPYTIQKRFVELAGGAGRARVAIFPMAATEYDEEAEEVLAELKWLGADAVLLNMDREQAQSREMEKVLTGFTGYWFLGGDQNVLAASLLDTRALRTIEFQYEKGAVIGGTSAGAAVMTATMLTGERRTASGRINEDPNAVALRSTVVTPGFGLLPGAIIDQHFSRRSRDNRLVSAILDNPQLLGVGIDEETALVVRPDGKWEVLGNGHIKIYDARRAYIVNEDNDSVGASGIRLHVLPRGSQFDPKLGRLGSWRNQSL